MIRALIWKELRETWWIALIAFLWIMSGVWVDVGLPTDINFSNRPLWTPPTIVPFEFRSATYRGLWLPACFLGLAIGLMQTLGEEFRGTWLYLRHRPAAFATLMRLKLATGLTMTLLALGVPVLIYALFAATSGTHAAPFYWWMAAPAFGFVLAGSLSYLGGFLVGIRPARWLGTKFWPLVTVAALGWMVTVWVTMPNEFLRPAPVWLLIVLADLLLIAAIQHVARARDYA